MSKYAKIGNIYKLNLEEFKLCEKTALNRLNANIEQKKKNLNYSGRNDYDINLQGVIGEYAFSKLFPQEDLIDWSDVHCRNVLNDTFDGKLHNGWFVDVKTTLYDGAPLMVSINKLKRPADIYMLMIIDKSFNWGIDFLPQITYKGMIHATTIFKKENQITFKNKTFYQIEQKYLTDYLNTIDDMNNLLIDTDLLSIKPPPVDF